MTTERSGTTEEEAGGEDHLRMMEEGDLKFATGVVRLFVPETVEESKLDEYLRGIGRSMATFEGFTSRKIVEVPSVKGKQLVVLVKFSASSGEEAYQLSSKWERSEELKSWRVQARALGIRTEGVRWKAGSVAHVYDVGSTRHESHQHGPPPKWKMCVLIEFWVFVSVVFNGFAGTGPALMAAFNNAPFALFVELATVTPVLVYTALPLTLKIACISAWTLRRCKRGDVRGGCVDDTITVLEDGFNLFTPDDSTKKEQAALKQRVAFLERKLDSLQRALVLDDRSGPSSDGQFSAAAVAGRKKNFSGTGLDVIKRQHRVPNMPSQGGESDTERDPKSPPLESSSSSTAAVDEGGVTVAAKHYVKWGCQRQFEAWAEDISEAMRQHPSGGFLGADLFRDAEINGGESDNTNNDNVFVTLFRFATLAQLESWLDSDRRAEFLLKLQPYVEATTDYVSLGTSLKLVAEKPDMAFDHSRRAQNNLLGELLFQETSRPRASPALYKSSILTLFGLFLVAWVIGAHLGPPLASSLPHFLLVIFILTTITVIGNSYFGAPLMTFLFSNWLSQTPSLDQGKTPNALVKFLVLGTDSTLLQATLLFLYFAILVLAGILKNG